MTLVALDTIIVLAYLGLLKAVGCFVVLKFKVTLNISHKRVKCHRLKLYRRRITISMISYQLLLSNIGYCVVAVKRVKLRAGAGIGIQRSCWTHPCSVVWTTDERERCLVAGRHQSSPVNDGCMQRHEDFTLQLTR